MLTYHERYSEWSAATSRHAFTSYRAYLCSFLREFIVSLITQ
jgi:hypothetical protein